MSKKMYKVVLTLYGPVHVGMGTVLTKSEYVYDFYKNTVHIIDLPKLTRFLEKRNLLDKFTNYLIEFGNRADLKRFLKEENIQSRDWQNFIKNTIPIHQGKTSPIQKNRGRQSNQRSAVNKPMNDLHLMVRNGRGEVYIPGSSLKGALRTSLLESHGNDNRDNQIFSHLQVSDSLPISENDLAIYQKIDVNKTMKPMPLYRECVDVGTKVIFTLAIDDQAGITIEEIQKRITNFYQNYWNKWLVGVTQTPGGKEFVINGGIPEILRAKNYPQVIFLGAGAGFVSKTLQYQMYDKEKAKKETFNVLSNRFRNVYGKFREVPKNVPLVLKATVDYSKNSWYQQGACTIEFERTK